MSSLKKQIQAALKLHSMKMHFYDIETRYKTHSNFGEDSAKLSEISEKFSEIPVSLSEISEN